MAPRTFLITGVSSGFGRAFAKRALAAGDRVVGTVRTSDSAADFEQLAAGRAHARILDMSDDAAVVTTVAAIERDLGPIDVLIANAGYGHEGMFEESTMAELRDQFGVNVFGTVAIMKAVLPGMRERRHGHIVVITSVGGLIPSPTLSFYNGSKFAMEGITRSLAGEVARFGVHVTAVEPGAFRTEWSGRSMRRARRTVADYDQQIETTSAARAAYNGKQPGDPAKAGDAVLALLDSAEPPTHLLLGSDAVAAASKALTEFSREIETWAHLSASTDYTT